MWYFVDGELRLVAVGAAHCALSHATHSVCVGSVPFDHSQWQQGSTLFL